MLDRRTFLAGSLLGGAALELGAQTSITAQDLIVSYEDGKFGLDIKDLKINGLDLPKFTWGWVGLAVGQGLLVAAGGQILGLLVDALSSRKDTMEAVMARQLSEFAQIIIGAIDAAAQREYEADITSHVRLYREYVNDPTAARLDYLTNNSAVTLGRVEALGFKAYRAYLTAAGLRLSILQEVAKAGRKGAETNFKDQRAASVSYHERMAAFIDQETDPVVMASRSNVYLTPVRAPIPRYDGFAKDHRDQPALGGTVNGLTLFDRDGAWIPPDRIPDNFVRVRAIDWAARRRNLHAASTDIGAPIVETWLKSPARAKKTMLSKVQALRFSSADKMQMLSPTSLGAGGAAAALALLLALRIRRRRV